MLENENINKNLKFGDFYEGELKWENNQHSIYFGTRDKNLDGTGMTRSPRDKQGRKLIDISEIEDFRYRYVKKYSTDQIECAMLYCDEEMVRLINLYLPEKERAMYNF